MNLLTDIYSKKIVEIQHSLQFWEHHLEELKSLDFNTYANKLKVETLVPIGNKIMFRGEAIHTNEIIAAIGADYFVKCSVKQAELLREHRIKVAESKLNILNEEKKFIENHINFSQNLEEFNTGQEIIEPYNEETELAWNEKHKENLKLHKQKKQDLDIKDVTDEELWMKLDELELQEEFEQISDTAEEDTTMDECKVNTVENFDNEDEPSYVFDFIDQYNVSKKEENVVKNIYHDQLNEIMKKQNELKNALLELQSRNQFYTKTSEDLAARVEELEKYDDIQDDMHRIDELINSSQNVITKVVSGVDFELKHFVKRRVSFADEGAKTLEICFTHSDTSPPKEPYDPLKGILKPSDVYEAYSKLCSKNKLTSILKKSASSPVKENYQMTEGENASSFSKLRDETLNDIILKDVTENRQSNEKTLETEDRPPSLFKIRRAQKSNKY